MLSIHSAKKKELNETQFNKLYQTLITAYELTEEEVWGPNYVRISSKDYKVLIEKDEVLVAMIDNDVVGGVHYYERENGVFAFSLLCADFTKSGLGIGRALINAVEELAKKNKAKQIQIEILRAKGIEVPFKVRLAQWYERLGFKYTHSENFAEVVPEKGKNLVNPSDFDYYLKELS